MFERHDRWKCDECGEELPETTAWNSDGSVSRVPADWCSNPDCSESL